MEGSAIKEIHDNAAATLLREPLSQMFTPAIALPDNFRLHSLENYNQLKSRFTGKMVTNHHESFVSYHRDFGARADVFVNPKTMTATAIFDIGTPSEPGHCEHSASLTLQRTAPFEAFTKLFQRPALTQRDLAEWIEDWHVYVTAIDNDDSVIETKRLIATVRRITIESVRNADSTEGNFSSTKSAMEKIEARSNEGSLPKVIIFNCEPYAGLPNQDFRFRISVRTGGDISFGAVRIKEERDAEIYADNFIEKLTESIGVEATLFQGVFSER